MKTVTHEEYLLLNSVQRNGYIEDREFPNFDYLKKKMWVTRSHLSRSEALFGFYPDEVARFELSSSGRLEHNLYERIHRYSDGSKLKPETGKCPRCWDSDSSCLICCGYAVDGKIHTWINE